MGFVIFDVIKNFGKYVVLVDCLIRVCKLYKNSFLKWYLWYEFIINVKIII